MQNGYLIALSRENAKLVFAAREDSTLAETIDGLLQDETIRQSGYLLDCGKGWQQIQDALETMGGDAPMEQVLLGGRPM